MHIPLNVPSGLVGKGVSMVPAISEKLSIMTLIRFQTNRI
jgi:hypothetical protein